MYKARLKDTDLNYRDSPPINGGLGKKLGTWRLVDDPILTVLDVKDEWASVYWNDEIVYASNLYLEKIDIIGDCSQKFIELGEEINKVGGALVLLTNQFNTLYQQWEHAFDTEPDEPDFSQRLENDWGWKFPVFSNLLSSDESDHSERNSPTLAWDVSINLGSPVYALADGIVKHVYRTKNSDDDGPGGFGTFCIIDHETPNGVLYRFWYAHLTSNSLFINNGDRVTSDTLISHVSWEGITSFGPHLHLQVKQQNGARFPVSNFWDIDDFYYDKYASQSDYE